MWPIVLTVVFKMKVSLDHLSLIFVLKRDVKLQLTNSLDHRQWHAL